MACSSGCGVVSAILTTILAVLISCILFAKLLRNLVFIPKLTILHDLPHIGKKRKDGKLNARAVICGGSVAGLFAAAVLSDHFDSVLVCEAEGSPVELGMEKPKARVFRALPNGLPTPVPLRKRISQYLAIHDYGPALLMALKNLFCEVNLKEELDYFGFHPVPLAFYFNYGNVLSQEVFDPTDTRTPKTLSITREAMETLLRRLVVKQKRNITFVTGTVRGFQRGAKGDQNISGVKLRTESGDRVEPADFVVDATGPAQVSYHKWLGDAGYEPLLPSLQNEYDPRLSYAQSIWTLPEHVVTEIAAIVPYGRLTGSLYINNPDPATGDLRSLYISLFESSQLMIVTNEWGAPSDSRPHTIDEVRKYARSLHNAHMTPDWVYKIFDVLEANHDECAPWYSDVHVGRMSYIKYHEVARGTLPSNWIAVGDSAMTLNPIYAQGCTKAMIEAVTLDSLLRRVSSKGSLPSDFPYTFFRKASARTGEMWEGNKALDYGFPTTKPAEGETLDDGAFLRSFSRYFLYAGRQSRSVQAAFYELSMGLAPSTDAFAPSILVQVAWQWLKIRFA